MLRSPLKLELQEIHLTPVGAATWPALKRGSTKPVRLHCGMLSRLAVAPASHICTSHLLTAVGRSHTALAEKFLLAVMVHRLLCRNLKQCGPLDRFLHMAGGCWIGLMSSRDIEPGSTACTQNHQPLRFGIPKQGHVKFMIVAYIAISGQKLPCRRRILAPEAP